MRCVHGAAHSCSAPATAMKSRSLMRRDPDVGVACPRANSIACDRVGLAVWLDVRATRVTATIDGRALSLDRSDGTGSKRPWIGYLRPAGLLDGELAVTPDRGRYHWEGRHPKRARVVVRVTRTDGSRVVARVVIPLRAGWG